MQHTITERSFRVAFFSTVKEAEMAIHRLLAAGFGMDHLAVICPKEFQADLPPEVPRAQRPGSHAMAGILEGGAVGAIGGIGLAAVAIATGGVALLPAVPILIGGGALAGGFSGLILRDGYGKEIGEYYEEAIRLGKIVVGVKGEGDDTAERLAEAEYIMSTAGGRAPADMAEA